MSTIPRVSIIVPLVAENAAFEATLASVLQHRCVGSEVIVAHDGHYRDPFDLSDEVTFVTSDSTRPADLIRSAVKHCNARFVHVLAPGYCATDEWIGNALQLFGEASVGAVAPQVVDAESDRVVSGGWQDQAGQLCCPVRDGRLVNDAAARVSGCFLHASFWRHSVLESVLESVCGPIHDLTAVSYATGLLMEAADWDVLTTVTCKVVMQTEPESIDPASRGRQLAALRHVVTGEKRPTGLVASLTAAMTGRISISEMMGQLSYRPLVRAAERSLHPEYMICREDSDHVLPFQATDATPARRAA